MTAEALMETEADFEAAMAELEEIGRLGDAPAARAAMESWAAKWGDRFRFEDAPAHL